MAFKWTAGVDWGSSHYLSVIRDDGIVVGHRRVAHTIEDVHAAVAWMLQLTGSQPDAIAIAIETPRGILVDTLLEQGFRVFAINPKQLDKFRDRHSAGGAKDDGRDGRALGDSLRTDPRAFRPVRPDDPQIIYLRDLCRMAEEAQATINGLTNRLREQLYRVDAAWLEFTPAADEPWLWELLRTAPHPDRWARLSTTRLRRVLQEARIRRITSEELRPALQRPRLHSAAGVADAVAIRIAALVPQLLLVDAQRRDTERRLDAALAQLTESAEGQPCDHCDVIILRSLPGVGRTVAATMLTEAAGPLADRDYLTLRAYGGTAPITKRSSKRTYVVQMRYACKRRLRNALYYWSFASLRYDPAARAYYDALRARGHHHARALRSVADRWLRILIAMLRTGTTYDASRLERVPTA